MSTAEVARAYLVSEPTMAARVTRAKEKIAVARIPYRVPPAAELPGRVDAVLAVVHLLFTTGHTTPVGDELARRDLVERSLELRRLLPRDPAVAGLLALLLLTDSRRETRTPPEGRLLLLEEQDRARWNRATIAEGVSLVHEALRARPPSRYALQAAIAAVHAEASHWEDTDWREILALYDELIKLWASPVMALNSAVAVSFVSGPLAGLAALNELSSEPQLAGYGYLPAADPASWSRVRLVGVRNSALDVEAGLGPVLDAVGVLANVGVAELLQAVGDGLAVAAGPVRAVRDDGGGLVRQHRPGSRLDVGFHQVDGAWEVLLVVVRLG
jgi:RNA polymerase sigma-70 factor (ECF subfamily)